MAVGSGPDMSYSSSHFPIKPSSRDIVAVSLGVGIEFFDFSIYATFALMIGQTFFPSEGHFTSLLFSVSTFAVGFIARPLGALLLGSYGDRIGRKPIMLISLIGMALGTAGMAFLPGYASIGPLAPILLVVCRLLQGLSWGAEAGPSTSFLMEAAPPHRRGFYVSWQVVAQGCASLLGGLIGYGLNLVLNEQQLTAWGWRIPFVLGLAFMPVAFYLRWQLEEKFQYADCHQAPLRAVFGRYLKAVVIGILMISGSTITQYFLYYLVTYARHDLGYSGATAMASPIVVGLGVMLFSLLGGWLSDRFGARRVIIVPRLLLLALLWPCMALINAHLPPWLYLSVVSLLTALQCISGAGLVVALCLSFPQAVRASGFSVTYTFGITLFGGTAQALFAWLVQATGQAIAPLWYLIATNLLCILASLCLPPGYQPPEHANQLPTRTP